MSADVTISTSANTFTDLMTSTLGGTPSGHTFLIAIHVLLHATSIVGSPSTTIRLTDGTNTLAETTVFLTSSAAASGFVASFPGIIYSPVSNVTLHVQGANNVAISAIIAKAAALANSGGNFASWFTYLQIA